MASVGKVLRSHSFWRDYLRRGMDLKKRACTDFSVHLRYSTSHTSGSYWKGVRPLNRGFPLTDVPPIDSLKGDVLF